MRTRSQGDSRCLARGVGGGDRQGCRVAGRSLRHQDRPATGREQVLRRGCRAGRGGDRRLEGLLAEVHHGEVDTLDNLAFGGQPWQHVLREKVCHGDLSGVEERSRSETSPSSALSAISAWWSSSQPISRSPTASRNANRLQPDAIQLAGVLLGATQIAGHGRDHRLQVGDARWRAVFAFGRIRGGRLSLSRNACDLPDHVLPGPRRGRGRSCGRRSPAPGSRWCPRTASRSWRRGCTARSGSPAGSPNRRRSAAIRSGTGRRARSPRP